MCRALARFAAAFALTAPLFCAAPTAWCQAASQSLPPQPQTVAVEDAIYQIGVPELIAPAPVGNVFPHPTGRYALIVQEIEERAANAGSNGKPIFGAAALLLYDAKLHKTRTVWKRHAATKRAGIYPAWLPKSDCAIVSIDESPAPLRVNKEAPDALGTLLFFNFATSLAPRVLISSPEFLVTSVSPLEPLFIEWDLADNVTRMGSAPHGTLGPVLQTMDFEFKSWSSDGKTAYGREFFHGQYDTPPQNEAERLERLNAKPESALQWYKWDGKSREATKITAPQSVAINPLAAPPPVLPLALRMAFLPVPPPSEENAPLLSPTNAPIAVLRPLFLEASRIGTVKADRPNRFALVAPDATEAHLFSDLSAVLYKSGGALYVVSLTRLKAGELQTKQYFP